MCLKVTPHIFNVSSDINIFRLHHDNQSFNIGRGPDVSDSLDRQIKTSRRLFKLKKQNKTMRKCIREVLLKNFQVPFLHPEVE